MCSLESIDPALPGCSSAATEAPPPTAEKGNSVELVLLLGRVAESTGELRPAVSSAAC
jgi:hypothetical protein